MFKSIPFVRTCHILIVVFSFPPIWTILSEKYSHEILGRNQEILNQFVFLQIYSRKRKKKFSPRFEVATTWEDQTVLSEKKIRP